MRCPARACAVPIENGFRFRSADMQVKASQFDYQAAPCRMGFSPWAAIPVRRRPFDSFRKVRAACSL